MGILNVTPDSFSDGGLHFDRHDAVDAALRMIDEGADLIDVGGESTRPGADPVPLDEEIRRTVPVIESLVSTGVHVSIDTMKPEVARVALDAGAFLVNDVSGLRDPEMQSLVQDRKPHVCIMHMLGEPRTMQVNPSYGDVVEEVREYLVGIAKTLTDMPKDKIWIDPGIGFGKTMDHNLSLLHHLDRLVETGFPVLIGVSRKSFLGKILGEGGAAPPSEERLEATLAAQVMAQLKGAKIIRTHDVKAAMRAVRTVSAIATAGIPLG